MNFHENFMLTKFKVTVMIFQIKKSSEVLLTVYSASNTVQVTWHTFIPRSVQLCKLRSVIGSIL